MNLRVIAKKGAFPMRIWICILVLLSAWSRAALCRPIEIASEQLHGALIGKSLKLYEDPGNSLTIEDLARLPDSAFFEVPRIVPAFGSTRSAYWARLDLVNKLDRELKIFLEYTYPLADVVEFQIPTGPASWKKISAGDRQNQTRETFRHRLPMASLTLGPQETQQVYIRVYNQGFTQFPIRIWTETEFHENRGLELSLTVSLLFVIAMMMFYNALLYITTREHLLGIYVSFLMVTVVCQLAPSGLVRMGEFNELAMYISNSSYLLTTNLSCALMSLVGMIFLEIPSRKGWLRHIVYFVLFFSFGSSLLIPISYSIGAQFVVLNTLLTLICLFGLTLISVAKGNKSSRYLLIAWTTMILCIALQQFYWFALVTNQYFAFGSLIGTAAEAILISLAIGHKMRSQVQMALRENERINQEILEKEKARTVFFHNTSHELRTPLNGIIGFLHLLLKGQYGPLNEAMAAQLSKTLRLAESLKNQVNTILDLARLKRGEMKLQNASMSLHELKRNLDELAEGLHLRYPNARYQSELITDDPSGLVHQDYDKLFAIGRNLLGNAFKFSDSHQSNDIRMRIHSTKDTLTISVRDSGLGIPREHLNRIFDEFVQVQSDARRSHEGTGLGLTMVRDFVKLMKGTIEVESELGKGSTFTLRLPRAGTMSQAIASVPEETPVSQPLITETRPQRIPETQPKDPAPQVQETAAEAIDASILVVDDNEINLEVITDLLAYKGYRSAAARSGREALDILQKQTFDLILLDIMMPEVSGEDVLRTLRQDPHLKDIPVILITARASEEDRIHGLNLGADDYVSKPIIAEELLLRVGNLLRRVEDARRKSQEESQEKFRQLGELFAFTSHEIKNVYNYIDENSKISFDEVVAVLSALPLPSADVLAMANALLAEESEASLQDCLEALPKIPRDQTVLRRLRTNVASLQMPLEKLSGVWQSVTRLTAEEQNYLNILLKWALNSNHLYKTVFRSRDIFQATLSFVHMDKDQECQLWSTLDPIITLLMIRAKKDGVQLEAEIPRVRAWVESTSLQQIVINLLGNAMDAVSTLPVPERKVRIWVESDPKAQVLQIKVSNAGDPLAASVQAQLFKRGFTTKGAKGNGIGLYISRKLAQRHQGELYLDAHFPSPCFILVLKAGKALPQDQDAWPRAV